MKSNNSLPIFFIIYIFTVYHFQAVKADVNVYSAVSNDHILPVLNEFTSQTGIKVNLKSDHVENLLRLIETEEPASSADVLITKEVGSLIQARKLGLLKKYNPNISAKIDEKHLIDSQSYWLGFSKQARIIVYSLDRIYKDDILNYENLSEKKWRDKICSGPSSNILNQAFVARLLYYYNVVDVLKYLNGFVSNFTDVFIDNDIEIVKAIANSECDIAVIDHTNLAQMINSKNSKVVEYAKKVGFVWPNQENRGASVNISSAGIISYSKNINEAEILLKYLISEKTQSWLSLQGFDYPVKKQAKLSETIKNFGTFKEDIIEADRLASLYSQAKKLMSFAAWQ